MKKKDASISEQILALSNPTPEGDVEDFWDEDTSAKVVGSGSDEASHDQSHDILEPSSLRRKAALDLQHETRYKGLKTSRSKLQEFSDLDEDEEEEEEDDDEEEEEEDEGEDIANKRKDLLAKRLQEMADESESHEEMGSDDISGDNDDDDDDADDDEEDIDDVSAGVDIEDDDEYDDAGDDDEDDDEVEEEEDEEEGDTGIQEFSQVNISAEVEKGKAVKAQLGLWDSFMQARIKMQKALTIANQLPQPDTYELFISEEGDEVQALVEKSQRELTRLLQSFVHLQDALLSQNPETEHVLYGEEPGKESNTNDQDDDDEEIPSDTDDEMDKEESKHPEALKPRRSVEKRKLDEDDIGEHLAKRHKNFESFRNATVQKWYEKTKLTTGKLSKKSFSGFERSALLQIQQILQDQDRLIKRTQLRRSEYTVLGQRSKVEEEVEKKEEEDKEKEDVPQPTNQHLKNYDPEIFDDDDFYHQLLRELIEKRTSSTTDPIQLTRQWLQVQKLRSKVKRLVDTKASKGRKLRYDVHQKLVSFMAPVDNSTMQADARIELYKSLFGQTSMAKLVER